MGAKRAWTHKLLRFSTLLVWKEAKGFQTSASKSKYGPSVAIPSLEPNLFWRSGSQPHVHSINDHNDLAMGKLHRAPKETLTSHWHWLCSLILPAFAARRLNGNPTTPMQDNPAVQFRTWGNDNISYGPVELPGLVEWIRQGRVMRNTWVFRDDKTEWARALDLPELKILFKSKTPATVATATAHGITPGALRRIKLFADMDERQLASFLQYMEVLKFPPGATVVNKGEHGDAMFLVLQGEVRARVIVAGRESTLAVMSVGECFGELSVLDESPRSADVIANLESIILKISSGALKRLFQEAPALAAPFLLGLNKTITSRVRTLTKRYEDSILFARAASDK